MNSRRNNRVTVVVLSDYDYFTFKEVDMATRKYKMVGEGLNKRKQISYKGKKYLVFYSPKVQRECIAVSHK